MNRLAPLGLLLLACSPLPAQAADLANGQRLFVLRCASCHAVGPSARAGFGPQLNAVIGRRAGSTPDFHYSAAMVKSNIVWNEKMLAAFLDSPGDLVPGTKMRFWGMSDRKQVADLLAYLRSIPPAPAR
jgi:cytochrome c